METAQTREQEVEELAHALTDTRSELKALQMRNTELLKLHNELAHRLRKKVKIITELSRE